MSGEANVTERQAKWFASVRSSLESSTGKTLAEWVAIARTCPETGVRARLKWLKDNHGLLQNRAMFVLDEAFGGGPSWEDPQALIDALWTNPASRATYEAVDAEALKLEGTIRTSRKGYTAWSRKVQYAAARPLKGGGVMLGLAVPPEADPEMETPRNESWSERLKARVRLAKPDALGGRLPGLLRAAWENA